MREPRWRFLQASIVLRLCRAELQRRFTTVPHIGAAEFRELRLTHRTL